MYNKILVPLDGSKLAECALPHAEELAKRFEAQELLLVSATERVTRQTRAPEAGELYHAAGPEVTVTFGKKEMQAQRYLRRVAKKVKAEGIKVRTDVLCWPPAESIAEYAARSEADLIVMSSHGRSGVSRWAHGSIASKVLQLSCVPVMVIKAPGCIPGF
ncbi:MAG: universal stress protein [Dehalococcoidia bacterium]|nr:universal stress protein [Dehalococcoidia bacterium]